MRYALAALALLACSDSTEPDHRIDASTYTLQLAGCFSCPINSTPGFAAQFRDGIAVQVNVSGVTDAQASGEITSFSGNAPAGLIGTSETMEFTEVAAGGPAYLGRWDYSTGLLTLGLRADGSCEFALFYPNVSFGTGTCEVQ